MTRDEYDRLLAAARTQGQERLALLMEAIDVYKRQHLNRALVLERDCARQYGYDPVCVIPQPKAGGSFATTAWKSFTAPVAVEHIRAHAGLDIGGTMIGMHLRDVAVPVRLSLDHIGQAILLCARTRPKLIGGSRAVYE